MASATFKSLFCKKFGCPPEDFEERAFRKLLYSHTRLFAPVARSFNANYFLDDFKFIRYVGDSAGVREITADVLEYNDFNKGHWRLFRTAMKIRVSGRKAQHLANQLFRESSEAKL